MALSDQNITFTPCKPLSKSDEGSYLDEIISDLNNTESCDFDTPNETKISARHRAKSFPIKLSDVSNALDSSQPHFSSETKFNLQKVESPRVKWAFQGYDGKPLMSPNSKIANNTPIPKMDCLYF